MGSAHELSIIGEYPRLFNGNLSPLLTKGDIKKQKEFLDTRGNELAKGGFKKDIITTEMGGRAFQALFSQGEDDHTIIVPAEYATGMGLADDRDAVMRAYSMREMINPDASLLYLPNNVHGENNLHLSEEERVTLRGDAQTQGNFNPLTDRVMTVLEKQNVKDDRLTGVGNSQGAGVVAALAARKDIDMHSVATFLPPDVIKRDKRHLITDFLSGGKNLFANIEMSKLETDSPFLDQNFFDLVKFARNAIDKDNRATMGPIMAGRHERLLQTALANTPRLTVVRGWTPNAAISPDRTNREIGDRLKTNFGGRVENRRITGEYADATSANVYPIAAGLARRAFIMANHLS